MELRTAEAHAALVLAVPHKVACAAVGVEASVHHFAATDRRHARLPAATRAHGVAEQRVRGRDVLVYHALAVRVRQSARELNTDVEDPLQVDGTTGRACMLAVLPRAVAGRSQTRAVSTHPLPLPRAPSSAGL